MTLAKMNVGWWRQLDYEEDNMNEVKCLSAKGVRSEKASPYKAF